MKLSLTDTWHGKIPALLVALRGQEELYAQALSIFQKNTTFHISGQLRLGAFKSMRESVLSNIRKLSISIRLVKQYYNRILAFMKLLSGKC